MSKKYIEKKSIQVNDNIFLDLFFYDDRTSTIYKHCLLEEMEAFEEIYDVIPKSAKKMAEILNTYASSEFINELKNKIDVIIDKKNNNCENT